VQCDFCGYQEKDSRAADLELGIEMRIGKSS
jgi:hypothetical protein